MKRRIPIRLPNRAAACDRARGSSPDPAATGSLQIGIDRIQAPATGPVRHRLTAARNRRHHRLESDRRILKGSRTWPWAIHPPIGRGGSHRGTTRDATLPDCKTAGLVALSTRTVAGFPGAASWPDSWIFSRDGPRIPRLCDRRWLGLILTNIGNLQDEVRNFTEAIAAHPRARSYHEALVKQNPTATQDRADLANSHANIANVQVGRGRLDECLRSMKEALEILEGLVREHPSVLAFRRDLLALQNTIGYPLSSHGRLREAIAYYKAAIEGGRALIREYPSNPQLRSGLAVALTNYGNTALEMGVVLIV